MQKQNREQWKRPHRKSRKNIKMNNKWEKNKETGKKKTWKNKISLQINNGVNIEEIKFQIKRKIYNKIDSYCNVFPFADVSTRHFFFIHLVSFCLSVLHSFQTFLLLLLLFSDKYKYTKQLSIFMENKLFIICHKLLVY